MRSLFFQGGTLVVDEVGEHEVLPAPFSFIKGRWRCEGYHYGGLAPTLITLSIADRIPRWRPLDCPFQPTYEPHAYQVAALDAWEQANRRGSIVLPTGAGKTYVALHAIHRVNRSAVVVAPTLDLLHQWYAILCNVFQTEVGVYSGTEKKLFAEGREGEEHLLPLVVTTYHSAGDLMAAHGHAFKLIIFDEVHHLPAPQWGETALMAPAPARLGLTATYPTEREQGAGRWRVDELIGPLVYTQRIEDLLGEQLALYRTQRVRVDLTSTERAAYDADAALYLGLVRSRQLQRTHGAQWLQELMRLSAFDREARRALLARQRIGRLLACCEGKLRVLDALVREHTAEQMLVFTENNQAAYLIARRHLVPVITHETDAAERKHILEAFRAGHYRVIVTSRVLNEGVDVPEAKVAVVLGGTAGAREYIQRLGRILRKRENRQAVLYEVLARGTSEEGKVQRRHASQREEAALHAHV